MDQSPTMDASAQGKKEEEKNVRARRRTARPRDREDDEISLGTTDSEEERSTDGDEKATKEDMQFIDNSVSSDAQVRALEDLWAMPDRVLKERAEALWEEIQAAKRRSKTRRVARPRK